MAPDQDLHDRDTAVRAVLVAEVRRASTPAPAQRVDRLRVGLVTGVVLAVVVALSVLAIRVGGDRSALPVGGTTPTGSPTSTALPTISPPAGVLLGRWTSDDGPVQTHTIHPDGLALATTFACSGTGDYSIRHAGAVQEAGYGESGSPGACGNSGSSSSKGMFKDVSVTITTDPGMRWTYTIIGIPETYVTPKPVLAPTESSGRAVPFCSGSDLTVRYEPYDLPKEVTEARGGQIVLTNAGSFTCALAGYPGVRFLDAGTPLGHHTMNAVDDRNSMEKGLRPVILAPGGHAYSQIGYHLPNYYPGNESGTCEARSVHAFRVDLANTYAGAEQQGAFDVHIDGRVTACLNGPWGVFGKYGQISSTVFVDYSAAKD